MTHRLINVGEKMLAWLLSKLVLPVPIEIRERLSQLQYEQMCTHVPKIQIFIIVNLLVFMANNIYVGTSKNLLICLGLLLIIYFVHRTHYWIAERKRNRRGGDLDKFLSDIRIYTLSSVILVSFITIWSYSNSFIESKWVIPVCVSLCLSCIAYSFSAMRESSFFTLLVGIGPNIIILFSYGDITSVSMATVLLSVMLLNMNFVDGQFRSTLARLQLEKKIQDQANRDALTQLGNRRHFLSWMRDCLGQQRNYRIAIALLDLDGFKLINDQYGHLIGDRILQHVADQLSSFCGSDEFAARLGGDEFVIVMHESPAQLGDFQQRCDQLLAHIAEPTNIGEAQYSVQVTIGYVIYPDQGSNGSQLMSKADQALYRAKSQGKNLALVWRDPVAHVAKPRHYPQLDKAVG